MSSWEDVPSEKIVSVRLVQARGAASWTNGGRFTLRGAGTPVRPPAVWVNRTQPSPVTGAGCLSGNATAAKVIPRPPSLIVVEPI